MGAAACHHLKTLAKLSEFEPPGSWATLPSWERLRRMTEELLPQEWTLEIYRERKASPRPVFYGRRYNEIMRIPTPTPTPRRNAQGQPITEATSGVFGQNRLNGPQGSSRTQTVIPPHGERITIQVDEDGVRIPAGSNFSFAAPFEGFHWEDQPDGSTIVRRDAYEQATSFPLSGNSVIFGNGGSIRYTSTPAPTWDWGEAARAGRSTPDSVPDEIVPRDPNRFRAMIARLNAEPESPLSPFTPPPRIRRIQRNPEED
jgi:hypothetical protein